LSWQLLARAYLWLGMLEAAVALTVFFFVLQRAGWQYGDMLEKFDPVYLQATSACLAAIVVAQMVNVFLCRHPSKTGWSISYTKNRLLLFGLVAELGLILLITYSPLGNKLFATNEFEPLVWGVIIVLALGFGVLEETRKYFVRRGVRERKNSCESSRRENAPLDY
jgi:magnesium-transporting ATPase (P-type)